jgi:hypothetical protein
MDLHNNFNKEHNSQKKKKLAIGLIIVSVILFILGFIYL